MIRRILIAGIGRPNFGDDAVGLLIAEKLEKRFCETARVVLDERGGWDILDALGDEDVLVVVDAAHANDRLPVGKWIRIDLSESSDDVVDCDFHTTHSFSAKSWLDLARKLGKLPTQVHVYAIAGSCFEPEKPLSPSLLDSIGQTTNQIEADVRLAIR